MWADKPTDAYSARALTVRLLLPRTRRSAALWQRSFLDTASFYPCPGTWTARSHGVVNLTGLPTSGQMTDSHQDGMFRLGSPVCRSLMTIKLRNKKLQLKLTSLRLRWSQTFDCVSALGRNACIIIRMTKLGIQHEIDIPYYKLLRQMLKTVLNVRSQAITSESKIHTGAAIG